MEWIQTHISHVFLVGDRVYKLRKGVCLSFLDFSSVEKRNADCLREIALNRRLAPDVYLGVAAVSCDPGKPRMSPPGESIDDPESEHVVVMRRLPEGRDALSLLERDRLGPADLEAVAECLERFHAQQELGRPAPWTPEDWIERTAEPILDCFPPLLQTQVAPEQTIESVRSGTRERIAELGESLERRRAEGRAVDGHGDLHLDHIWFEDEDSAPLLIDCLEFDDDLRRIDRAAEVAFLAMDLRYRDRADLAEAFTAAYAGLADDHGLYPVIDLHAAYRALVRAKVAALASCQSRIDAEQRERARGSARRHLDLARELLAPPGPGALLLTCGTVGSGKSTVARHVGRRGMAVPISSDRLRKRLAGVAPSQSAAAPPDQGIYTQDWTQRVYRELLERAGPVIDSGRTALLDASFARREQRDVARAWAAQRGIPVHLIEVRCRPGIARERLSERSRRGADPSDAGPDFLPVSQARFEPPVEWEPTRLHRVWTDRAGWKGRIEKTLGAETPQRMGL